MKVNKKYMHAAAVQSAIDLGSVEDLANKTADHLNGVEVHNAKGDGFTLRLKKSTDIDYEELTGCILKAVCEILEDDLENAMDYIMENYEFVYDGSKLESKHIRELFDYSQNGRLLYVEIDM